MIIILERNAVAIFCSFWWQLVFCLTTYFSTANTLLTAHWDLRGILKVNANTHIR